MITLTLKDTQGQDTFNDFEPHNVDTIEDATDVVRLDNSIRTNFKNQPKRVWNFTWSYKSDADYQTITGYYYRQFTNRKYPTLSMAHYGHTDIPVRMKIGTRNIVDNCLHNKKLSIELRETTN